MGLLELGYLIIWLHILCTPHTNTFTGTYTLDLENVISGNWVIVENESAKN